MILQVQVDRSERNSWWNQLSHEKNNKNSWHSIKMIGLIGILIMAYYNPHIPPYTLNNQSFFIAQLTTRNLTGFVAINQLMEVIMRWNTVWTNIQCLALDKSKCPDIRVSTKKTLLFDERWKLYWFLACYKILLLGWWGLTDRSWLTSMASNFSLCLAFFIYSYMASINLVAITICYTVG